MNNTSIAQSNRIIWKDLIKYFILSYWILFWLFNIMDKIIGGAHFLFVGKDRFAQVQRFFDSIGLGDPLIANIALIITVGLEAFALVFFCGALFYLIRKNIASSLSWFFIGITLTLITFTYFSIGDQVFGDHFELLEHGLFWFIGFLSWMVFIRIDKVQFFDNFSIGKKQFLISIITTACIAAFTIFSIFWHNSHFFFERTQPVDAVRVSENIFKIKFPFLAGSKAFENSLAKFKTDHPTEHITYIYTAPNQLRLAESDGLIIYFQTQKNECQ